MYDTIISWLVTNLRTDITAVTNRVTAKGAYFNPTLPRLSVGYPLSLNEEASYIGNKIDYTNEGNILNTKIPIEIIATSAKQRDQIGDAILTSILTTRRGDTLTNGILDLRIVAENNIDEGDDPQKPNIFRKVLDVEIIYERI